MIAVGRPAKSARLGSVYAHLNGYVATLVGDSLIYLIGAGLVGAGNVVLLPLYTRCLDAAHFGAYALLDVSILIVVMIAQLGFGITYLKWFADLDRSRHGELLGSVAAVTLVTGVICGILLSAGVRYSAFWTPMAGRWGLWSLFAIVPIESVQGILLADLRARRRSILFCAAAATRLLIMAGASVWFVQFQRLGITGILLGRAIGGAIGVAMLALLSLPFAAPAINLSLIRGMLIYGLPLVWSALVGVGLDASGRYLLARFTTLEEVAIYTVALKISALMQVGFLQPFGTAWSSIMFQIARDKAAPASITRILGHAFVFGMIVAATISIVAPLILPLFGKALYARAASLVPLLLLPSAFRILEYWSSAGLYISSQTGMLAAASTAGALLNIGTLLLFAPSLGAFGAALAWILSLSITICGNAWLSKRYYRLPTSWCPLVLGFGIWTVGAATSRIIPVGLSLASCEVAGAGILVVTSPLLYYVAKELLRKQNS